MRGRVPPGRSRIRCRRFAHPGRRWRHARYGRWSEGMTGRVSSRPVAGRRWGWGVAQRDVWDVFLARGGASFAHPGGDPDGTLTAEPQTWDAIADDLRGGMA